MKSWGDRMKISEAPFNKLARLIIAGAFLFNTTVTDLAWAREVSPVLSPVGAAADSGLGHPSVGDIKVPEQYGRLKESFSGNSGKLIIQIQDIHSNYEGQKNLANILISLIEDHKLKVIMMEGGITDRDFSYLRMWHSVEERKKKAAKLLKDGVITGEAYVNIATDYPLKFQGAEDRELYEKNMDAYLKTELFAEEGLQLVTRLRNISDNLKRNMYNRALKRFDKKLVAYHNEQIGFTEYLELLKKTSEKNKIDLKAYTDFGAILNLMSLESKINFAKVERERDDLISQITNSGRNRAAIEQLYNKGTEFKEGKISQNEFYNYLISLAQDFEVDLTKYSNLNAYVDYITAYRKIDISSLFEDINELEGVIISSLSKNAGERELSKISRHLGILEKFLKLKLIPQDFAYFKANKNDFFTKDWLSFLKLHSSKFRLSTFVPDDVSIIDNNIPILGSFYEAAIARDYAFVRNTLSKMNSENENFSCLIAGGFHTQHLTQLFREEGISYVVIAPKAKATTDDKVYKKELKDSYSNRIWDEISPMLASRSQMREVSPFDARDAINLVNAAFDRNSPLELIIPDETALEEALRNAPGAVSADDIEYALQLTDSASNRRRLLELAGFKLTPVKSVEQLPDDIPVRLSQLPLLGPPLGPIGPSGGLKLLNIIIGDGTTVYLVEKTPGYAGSGQPFKGFISEEIIEEKPKETAELEIEPQASPPVMFIVPAEKESPEVLISKALRERLGLSHPDKGPGDIEKVLKEMLIDGVNPEGRDFFARVTPTRTIPGIVPVEIARAPEGRESGLGAHGPTGREGALGPRGDKGQAGLPGTSQQASIIPKIPEIEIPGITTTPKIPGITTPAVNPLWYIAGLTPAQIRSLLGQATVDLARKVADEVRAAEDRASPMTTDQPSDSELGRITLVTTTIIGNKYREYKGAQTINDAAELISRVWKEAGDILAGDTEGLSNFSPELITQETLTIALLILRAQSANFNLGIEGLRTRYNDGEFDGGKSIPTNERDLEFSTVLASYIAYPDGNAAGASAILDQVRALKQEIRESNLTPDYAAEDLGRLEPALLNMLVTAKRVPKARQSLTSRFTPENARAALDEQIERRTPLPITAFSLDEARSMMLIAAVLVDGDLGEARNLVAEVYEAQILFAESGIRMDPRVILYALAAQEGATTVERFQRHYVIRASKTTTVERYRDHYLVETLSQWKRRGLDTEALGLELEESRIFLLAASMLVSDRDETSVDEFNSIKSAIEATNALVKDLRRAGISPEVLETDAVTLALLNTGVVGGERGELERGAGIIGEHVLGLTVGAGVPELLDLQPTTMLAAVTIFGDGKEAETIVEQVLEVKKEIVESGFMQVPEDAVGKARQEAVILNQLVIAKSRQLGRPLSAQLGPYVAKKALETSLRSRASAAITELSGKEVELITKATLVETSDLEQAMDMAMQVDEVLRKLSKGGVVALKPNVVFNALNSMPEGKKTADNLLQHATHIADRVEHTSPLSITDEQAFLAVAALGPEANAETLATMLEVAPELARETGVTEEAAFASALRHPAHFDRFSSGVDRGPMITKTISESDTRGRKDLTKLSRGPVVTTVVVDHVTPENEVYVVVESGQVAPLTDGQTAKISEIGITEIRITSGVEEINMYLQDAISRNPDLKALQELLAPRRAVGHSNRSLAGTWPKETTKQAIALAGDLFNEAISRDELYIILHRLKLERNTTPIKIAMVGDISEAAIAGLQKIAAEFDNVELIGLDGLTADMIKAGYEDEASLMGYMDPETEIYIAVPRPKVVDGQVMELVSASNIFLAAFSYGAQKANLISIAELEALLERITKFLVIKKGAYIKTITDIREMERKALIAI